MAAVSNSTVGAPPSPPRTGFRLDDRYIAPVFITLILLTAQFLYGVLESPWKTALAIITSIAVEMVLGRMFSGKWPHFASAYVSGISVGILVRSPDYWPYAMCAALAIMSKYLIRVQNRHIWNPSNFAICAMLLIAHDKVATLSIQWGNQIWATIVIWMVGSVILYRLKRFHITLTYVICFLFFSFVRHLITKDAYLAEVSPITGPMYQLYMFFMITDPKTTVHTKFGQILVTVCIAFVEMILRLTGNLYAPYFALTMVGPCANLIEIYMISRNPQGALKAAAPGSPVR